MLDLWLLVRRAGALAALAEACRMAYSFRMHAINEFGSVVHEFDPWFHFRATEYLVQHGWHAFFHWFDHASWYPLGRPVATTIYPAMHITAAAILAGLNACGLEWTLEDVCCFVPVWGGVVATVFTALMSYECSGQSEAAAGVAALVMAILPAHLQRSVGAPPPASHLTPHVSHLTPHASRLSLSPNPILAASASTPAAARRTQPATLRAQVGGGFDNESVAIPAMCATFYFWCRAMRPPADGGAAAALLSATAAALSYAYMAAAWGGYVFVANVVALHACALLLLGRRPSHVRRCYRS